eukprot:6378710-Prymnesium_polylepis.1
MVHGLFERDGNYVQAHLMLCRMQLTLSISHSAVMPSILPLWPMELPARLCSRGARPSWGPDVGLSSK